MMTNIAIGLLAVCAAVLVAYTLGRRVGQRQGRRQALGEAPLRLRMLALREGTCPICDRPSGKWYNGRDEVMM